MKKYILLFIITILLLPATRTYSQNFNITVSPGVNFLLSQTENKVEYYDEFGNGTLLTKYVKELSSKTFAGISITGDYHFNKNLSLGLNIEYIKLDNYSLFPIQALCRVEFPKAQIIPYLETKAGYSICSKANYSGGFILGLGAGTFLKLAEKINLKFGLEYKYLNPESTQFSATDLIVGYENANIKKKTNLNFLNINLGISINL
jgi:hypothetical protein